MPELPNHTPDEAADEFLPVAIQALKAMDAQRSNEGTITLGPFPYAEAAAVCTAQASKAFEIARTQSLATTTACVVGVARDPKTAQFLSFVRYRRLSVTPPPREIRPPTASDVIRAFPAHAREALEPWRASGKNTTLVELGPFDQRLATAIADGVLPIALDLAQAASPYPHPDCDVAVVPGDVAWAVRVTYRHEAPRPEPASG